MKSNALTLILFLTLFRKYMCMCDTVLFHPFELDFGRYFFWHTCAPEKFATGFEIKTDREEKSFSDEQGMTGIRLICSEKDGAEAEEISSYNLDAGNWKGKVSCPSGEFITGFRVRIQKYAGWTKDDTGINDVEMKCNGNRILSGSGNDRGDWTAWVNCLTEEAVYGLRTKAEETYTADKAGTLGLNLICCNLNYDRRTTFDPLSLGTPSSEFENEFAGKAETGNTKKSNATDRRSEGEDSLTA